MVKISAHRGYTKEGKIPENTLESVLAAEDLGVDMAEFDVRKSKDGVWFLHHDKTFYDEKNIIKEMNFNEINDVAREKGKPLSTLKEVLNETDTIHLNIECKPNSVQAGYHLGKKIKKYGRLDDCNISSFSFVTLLGVRRANRNIKLSILGVLMPSFKWRRFHNRLELYSLNLFHKPLKRKSGKKKIQRAKKRGIEVHAWGMKSKRQMRKMIELDVDVIATDYPDIAMKIRSNILKTSTIKATNGK